MLRFHNNRSNFMNKFESFLLSIAVGILFLLALTYLSIAVFDKALMASCVLTAVIYIFMLIIND